GLTLTGCTSASASQLLPVYSGFLINSLNSMRGPGVTCWSLASRLPLLSSTPPRISRCRETDVAGNLCGTERAALPFTASGFPRLRPPYGEPPDLDVRYSPPSVFTTLPSRMGDP